MNGGYDETLRRRIDSLLQVRAGLGGNLIAVLMLWGLWGAGLAFWVGVGIVVGYVVFATLMARLVHGRTQRTLPNVAYFFANVVYAFGIMWVSGFAPHSLFVVPAMILLYDSFGEGETRPFVVAMLVVLTAAPLALGAPLLPVITAATVGWLIHWFSEGRNATLGAALRQLKARSKELVETNRRIQAMNCTLEQQSEELKSQYAALRAAQDGLVQSEKLSAIGQLAAGMAHEVNNPLAVILGFSQGMQRRLPQDSPLRFPVESIVRETLRCRTLVQELLTFSRRDSRTLESVDIPALLESTALLLEPRADERATDFATEIDRGAGRVLASRNQLQQVIVNLANNAFDAVERGGRVSLRARRAGDATVCIEVQDSGCGIPDGIRARIFEPFFTTKSVGKGTGLGLSLVHEIVTQHGGTLDVDSVVGKGTTMRIRLPLTDHAEVVA